MNQANIESIIEFLVSEKPHIMGIILFFSSIIEYIFPPFPGDSITLAGAILISLYNFDFFFVFLTSTGGSFAGSMIDFYAGKFFKKKNLKENFKNKLEIATQKFRKYGEIAILLNRFLPGIRAFLFVAAGFSGMKLATVAIYSFISISVWNFLIISAGIMVGKNFSILVNVLKNYNIFIWIAIFLIIIYFFIRYVWKKYSH